MVVVGDSVEVVQSCRPSHRNGQENTDRFHQQPKPTTRKCNKCEKITGCFERIFFRRCCKELAMSDDSGNTSTLLSLFFFSNFRRGGVWYQGVQEIEMSGVQKQREPETKKAVRAVQGITTIRSTPCLWCILLPDSYYDKPANHIVTRCCK